MSMTRVLHRLYLGDTNDAERLAAKNPAGIGTVITVCEMPVERRHPDIRYLDFPIEDTAQLSSPRLGSILSAISCYISRTPVLVHCSFGASRSPIVVAAYLDRIGYLDFEDALVFLGHLRFEVSPSRALMRSVQRALPSANANPFGKGSNDHPR